MTRVLITGAGSLVGHGILRCLRLLPANEYKIFTADPDHRAAGHWLGDFALLLPLAKDDNYISALSSLITRYQIDVLFVGTDPELDKISKAAPSLPCTTVVSSPRVISIGDDKWETVMFLKDNNFDYPDSALSSDARAVIELAKRVSFPLIAKPRIGARSVGLRTLHNQHDLQDLPRDYVIQEYLPDATGEFTAGTTTFNGKCCGQIIFRRDLKDGNTYRAYTYENASHEAFLKEVSERLDGTYGPLNFQYRLRNGKPVVFEINSRYSGTTPLRAAVGVNEVAMVLEYIKTGKLPTAPRVSGEHAILRTWSDVVVPAGQIDTLKTQGHLESPRGEYFPFMNK